MRHENYLANMFSTIRIIQMSTSSLRFKKYDRGIGKKRSSKQPNIITTTTDSPIYRPQAKQRT